MNWKTIKNLINTLLKGKKPKISGKVKSVSKKNTALVNKELNIDFKELKYQPATRAQQIFSSTNRIQKRLKHGSTLTKGEIAILNEYKLLNKNPKKWLNTYTKQGSKITNSKTFDEVVALTGNVKKKV